MLLLESLEEMNKHVARRCPPGGSLTKRNDRLLNSDCCEAAKNETVRQVWLPLVYSGPYRIRTLFEESEKVCVVKVRRPPPPFVWTVLDEHDDIARCSVKLLGSG